MPRLLLAATFLAGMTAWAAADKDQVRNDILKLAETVARGDHSAADQKAAEIAKKSQLENVMDLLKLRNKQGLGIGPAPGTMKPDGIEAQIISLSKRAMRPNDLEARAKDLAQAARITAAVALVAQHSCPVGKKEGDKDPKQWERWSHDMYEEAIKLAAAAEAHKPKDVKAVASKLDTSCNSCHAVFK
jgi:cytochrome c556